MRFSHIYAAYAICWRPIRDLIIQVKLVIKRSRVLSDGRHNIFFSIREPGKTPRLRKTGQQVFANRWDEDKGMIDPNAPNAQLINNELRKQIDALEKIVLDAKRDQRVLSPEQVYDLYEGKSETTGFVSFARQKLDTLKPHLALKTYKDYCFGIDKVEQYQPHVTFEQINKAWLQAYQLKQQRAGRKQNGIYHDFATLRRFFTLAQEENLTKNSPFRGFKFRQEETVRAFLMPDELARVDQLYHDGIDQLPFPAWKTLGFYHDFYGSNKGSGIIFFIFSVISDAGKNAVNNLVTHSVQYQHFILTLLYFSMIISSHLTLA